MQFLYSWILFIKQSVATWARVRIDQDRYSADHEAAAMIPDRLFYFFYQEIGEFREVLKRRAKDFKDPSFWKSQSGILHAPCFIQFAMNGLATGET